MRKIVILLIILIMVSVGFLSGCNENNPKYSIIGTWIDTYDMIWKFTDSIVYINFQSNEKYYSYRVDGDKLFIPKFIGEDNYYFINWIDDETLELKAILGNSISKETLKRYNFG